jgi:hypothetical protein
MKAFSPFIELNVKILNLFRDKEPAQFTAIVNEYANLLKELVGIVSQQSTEEVCNRIFKLKSFVLEEPVTLAADCLLKMDGLQLNSLLECSLLQNNITKVFLINNVLHGSFQIFSYFLINRFLLCQLMAFCNITINCVTNLFVFYWIN